LAATHHFGRFRTEAHVAPDLRAQGLTAPFGRRA